MSNSHFSPEYRRELLLTGDGSHTFHIPELDEHYHSVYGALQESMHVFIAMGLHEVAATRNEISILETGFGTGLNALLTALESEMLNLHTVYECIEPFPLSHSEVELLNYGTIVPGNHSASTFSRIHECNWELFVKIRTNFQIRKRRQMIQEFLKANESGPQNRGYDLVYFDAFSPRVQPEMWTEELFTSLYRLMNPGGVLTTYSASGDVRRAMISAGFMVEKLQGARGKREMSRGRKTMAVSEDLPAD